MDAIAEAVCRKAGRMIDIEYLERKKTELVADHVRRCGVTPLSKAEKIVISDLNYQIKALKDMQKGERNEN